MEVESNQTDIVACGYLVYTDPDGNICAYSGIDGDIRFKGTDAVTIIQNALNDLTPGRVTKERVVLKGDFNLSKSINVVPMCTLDLYNAQLKSSGNGICIQGSNITDSMIIGGFVDGSSQTDNDSNMRVINLNNCDRVAIKDTEIKSGGYYGLNLLECNECLIDHVYSHDNYRHGIHLGSDTAGRNWYNSTVNCICDSNGAEGINDRGSTIAGEKLYNSYTDNICRLNSGSGFNFRGGVVTTTSSVRFYVINCQTFDNLQNGFEFYHTNAIVTNPIAFNNKTTGIWLGGCNSVNIIGPLASNNGKTLYDGGIKLTDADSIACNNVLVFGGEAKYNSRNLYITTNIGSDNIVFVNVDCRKGIDANVKLVGAITNLILVDLKGCITKNDGMVTIVRGTSSIQVAHGLVAVPTFVAIGPTHAEVADAIWSVDATNITINVPSNVTADRNIVYYAEYGPN